MDFYRRINIINNMSSPISPAIIINEHYDTQVNIPTGYNILVMGYTKDGVSNEPVMISQISEFISMFGEPDGSRMEQIYAFDAVDRIVRGGSNAIFIKIPYGKNDGYEVGSEYTALLFGSYEDSKGGGIVSGSDQGALSSIPNKKGYVFTEPKRVRLTEGEYDLIKCGNINWNSNFGSFNITNGYNADEFGKAAMIVLDSNRTKTNDPNVGNYISVIDNTTADPYTAYNAISAIETSEAKAGDPASIPDTWKTVDAKILNFDLVTLSADTNPSISHDAINIASRAVPEPFENQIFDNFLSITLWRLREDLRGGTTNLMPSMLETYTGSISKDDSYVTEGGNTTSVFLGDISNKDNSRITILVNEHLASKPSTDDKNIKNLSIRMLRSELTSGNDPEISAPTTGELPADSLYSVTVYSPKAEDKGFDIGNLPMKMKSALCTVDNPDRVELDLSIDAGLSTIWTTCNSDADLKLSNTAGDVSFVFKDNVSLNITADLGRFPANDEPGKFRQYWSEVNDIFMDFAENVRLSNGGYKHLHVADTLRQILVNGRDCKVYTNKHRSRQPNMFAEYIYHPSKNLTKLINTSVTTVDAQWLKANTVYTPTPVWVPGSGMVAELFGKTPYPWTPAAGVANGKITNVVDIALDPVQRDRDLLWKIHHNASFYDRSTSGFLRFADQTQLKNDNIQLRQNSARRLLIWLEKNLRNDLRPFLQTTNNFQTRIKFKNVIEQRLKTLLDNGAIEDYAISLAKNTPESRQNGNLVADIAIKITGVVDRVILNFDILRLDQPFKEVM